MLDLNSNPRRKMAAYGLALVGVLGSGYTVANNFQSGGPSPIVVSASQVLVIQVSGAVKKPGLYKLSPGSRIDYLIKQAGGAAPDADLDRVNLAEALVDGSKVRIPFLSDPSDLPIVTLPSMQSSQALAGPAGSSKSSAASSSRKTAPGAWAKKKAPPASGVSLNRASLDELQALPGVGPSTAQKIIEFRNQVGGFKTIEQLMDVKGIGPKKFEKMKPYLKL